MLNVCSLCRFQQALPNEVIFAKTAPTQQRRKFGDTIVKSEVFFDLHGSPDLGVTVVMVIHQPRYSLFQLFDKLLLLAKGGFTVFEGKPADAVPYFSSLGFDFPEGENPSDVLLDIISGNLRLH